MYKNMNHSKRSGFLVHHQCSDTYYFIYYFVYYFVDYFVDYFVYFLRSPGPFLLYTPPLHSLACSLFLFSFSDQ